MENQLTGNQLRKMFLEYFEGKNHMIEPSASLVPINDPTLLWINSGVAALKKYFDGSQSPNNPRIANSQKAIRTNDIENVGFTARHHTFFEMLGNFSIGDYFRKEAIEFAWEFLTSKDYVGFNKDNLYVTIHPDDQESYDVWRNIIGLADDRIFKLEGNYWEIGEGPCGPNTEIFYDRGTKYDSEGKGLDLLKYDLENDRYIEIWNIVLSQYNAQEGIERSQYQELPQKNIDTGMGLERLVCIVQETESNFETDLFWPIIEKISTFTELTYSDNKVAYRVIADHIRTIVFAVNDGALFSNEGRGYVLRRLLRRASRYARELNINKPFMQDLVDVVVSIMNDFYQFEQTQIDMIKKMIISEEKQFVKTLQNGLKHLNDIIDDLDNARLSGKQAFMLYDTYGFPLELTIELCSEKNISVDEKGFAIEMELQKQRARNARKDEDSMVKQSKDYLDFNLTSDFIGYDVFACDTNIIGIFIDGQSKLSANGKVDIVLQQTPFYAESGGQVADSGLIIINSQEYRVLNVSKLPNGQHLHTININEEISINTACHACIDTKKRYLTQKNHTAAHIFFALLRKHLGNHVLQAGSYVDDKIMRFDFTHFEKVSDCLLNKIELEINDLIVEGVTLTTKYMSNEKAQSIGAIAQFDEKYGDQVRVVSIPGLTDDLCGGCHVASTSEIGVFKIESETSVGSGVRRVTAFTSINVYNYLEAKLKILNEITHTLKVKSDLQIIDRIIANESKLQNAENASESLQRKLNEYEVDSRISSAVNINNLNVVIFEKSGDDQATVKDILSRIVEKKNDYIALCILTIDQNQVVLCAFGNQIITSDLNAKNLINKVNELYDGKGGGKPQFAQSRVSKVVSVEKLFELF